MKTPRPARICASLVFGTLCLSITPAATPSPTSDWQAHVSSDVLSVYKAATTNPAPASASGGAIAPQLSAVPGSHIDTAGRVQVDVVFDCGKSTPTAAVAAAGLKINAAVRVAPFCIIEGWLVPEAIPSLASVAGVKQIKLPVYALRRQPKTAVPPPGASVPAPSSGVIRKPVQAASATPAIDGNGVSIMRADQFVSQTGTNGTGITIGVMSDDVTSLALIQGRGELPKVNVVPPTPGVTPTPNSNPTDEGTMMLEEIYAVAPGASLAFCGALTSADYIGCLGQLITAGATIVVDDTALPTEDLMSSNGQVSQAVQSILTKSPAVALFTVTDNFNGSYAEGDYAPVSLSSLNPPSGPLVCQGQTDYYVGAAEQLTVAVTKTYPLLLQWADPFGANVSNFDIYIVDATTKTFQCYSSAGSPNTYIGNPDTPISAGTYYFLIATPDQTLAGKFIKFYVGGDGDTELTPSTSGSIVSPQAFVPGVTTVGAVIGSDGLGSAIEPYSGQGPINLVFPTPTQIQAPTFVAPDAIYVDTIGTDFVSGWPDGLFHGTSAAAPNAAAVAALLRSAFPNMTPAQLIGAIQSGAAPLAATIPNGTFGYGRVDALGALGVNPGPGITAWPSASVVGGSSTSPASVTVSGFGKLSLSVTSSNAALIPATLVAAGKAGITVSPATCGSGTTACTIVATPVIGQIGTATITLTATDGAHRQGRSASVITVTKPPAPTISISAGNSQSLTEGGTVTPLTFAITGTGTLGVSASSSNTPLIPPPSISSGCGSSSHSCTATLGMAAGQTGTAMITLTIKDPYGQSSTATASIQVNAPSGNSGGGGGGGIVDFRLLSGLAILLLLRLMLVRLNLATVSQYRRQ
jgi:hypothetical protein